MNAGAARLRVLVVGAGPAASDMHLPVLADLRDRGGLVLSVICDLDPVRAANAQVRFGFAEKTGEAMAALKRRDIDVVYIFGSAQLHHSLGLAALNAGKHLFVEKPIAPCFTQACELAEAARLHARIAVGGHNRRFYKAFEQLRARSGALGWRYAEAVFHKPDAAGPVPFGARTWLSANGIHALDALVFMMGGLPEHLCAFAAEEAGRSSNAYSAIMRWRGGGQGVFLCNNHAGARHEEYVFHRIAETCRISSVSTLIEKDGQQESLPGAAVGDGILAEHEAFLDAVLSGRAPRHALAALAPTLFLAELIERGFSGSVMPASTPPSAARAAPQDEQCVLVSQAALLLPAIARLLPNHRLASIEDVERSSCERPDIVAALLGSGAGPLTAAILAKLPRLSIVGVMGLSLARHSPAALLARGVTLVNASAAYANSVAEFTLALAVLARRRAFASHELMRAGGWGTELTEAGLKAALKRKLRSLRPLARNLALERILLRGWRAVTRGAPRRSLGGDLHGASIGLIGWGGISQELARRLAALRIPFGVYSEHATAREIRAAGGQAVSLSEALACDIVSLHRGLSARTRHFLGAAELSQLRPGAVLINVARGALVDPAALLARLKRGDIFACLDSYEDEPLAPADPLRRLRNVFLTSHIAGGSPDMHAAAAEEVVRKVALHLQGGAAEGISQARLSTMT